MSKTRIAVTALLLLLVVAPAYASDGHQSGWSLVDWLEEQIAGILEFISDPIDEGGQVLRTHAGS